MVKDYLSFSLCNNKRITIDIEFGKVPKEIDAPAAVDLLLALYVKFSKCYLI